MRAVANPDPFFGNRPQAERCIETLAPSLEGAPGPRVCRITGAPGTGRGDTARLIATALLGSAPTAALITLRITPEPLPEGEPPLEAVLEDLRPMGRPLLDLLTCLTDSPGASPATVDPERPAELLPTLLLAAARRGPVILVLEELDQAACNDWDLLLDRIARASAAEGLGLIVLCTTGPAWPDPPPVAGLDGTFLDLDHSAGGVVTLKTRRLGSRTDVAQAARRELGHALADGLPRQLYAATRGDPAHLRACVQAMARDRWLRYRDPWDIQPRLDRMNPPATGDAATFERLQILRQVLSTGALAGDIFPLQATFFALELPTSGDTFDDLVDALDDFAADELGLIEDYPAPDRFPGQVAVRFTSPAIRRAVLAELMNEFRAPDRRGRAAAMAKYSVRLLGDSLPDPEHAQALVVLYRHAGDLEAAALHQSVVDWYGAPDALEAQLRRVRQRLGDWAGDARPAVVERLLDMAFPETPLRMPLARAAEAMALEGGLHAPAGEAAYVISAAANGAGDFAQGRAASKRAFQRLHEHGGRVVELQPLLEYATALGETGRPRAALRLLGWLGARAASAGLHVLAGGIGVREGALQVLSEHGDIAAAQTAWETAASAFLQAQHLDGAAEALALAGLWWTRLGAIGPAAETLERLRGVARDAQSPWALAQEAALEAELAVVRGDPTAALAALQREGSYYEQIGLAASGNNCTQRVGTLLMRLGQWTEADAIGAAIPPNVSVTVAGRRADQHLVRAGRALAAGELATARTALDLAASDYAQVRRADGAARVSTALSAWHRRVGDPGSAVAAAQRAIESASAALFVPERADALLELARAYFAGGDVAAAEDAADDALATATGHPYGRVVEARVRRVRGELARGRGDLGTAEREYRAALETPVMQAEEQGRAALALAGMYRSAGHVEMALTAAHLASQRLEGHATLADQASALVAELSPE